MKSVHTGKLSGMLRVIIKTAFFVSVLMAFIESAQAETYTKSYTYDLNGNVASRTSPDNATVNYTYDELNRLTNIAYPNSTTVSYGYDANGNRTSMSDPHGTTTYAY